MKTRLHRHVVGAALGAGVLALTGCTSSGSALRPKPSTTLQKPTVTLDPTRIPQPQQLGQRIGLGAKWQMTVVGSTTSKATLTVTVDLLNGDTSPTRLPAFIGELFTARDSIFGQDVHAISAVASPTTIASGAMTRLTLTYAPFANKKHQPFLLFRGARLDGSLDASVWLARV